MSRKIDPMTILYIGAAIMAVSFVPLIYDYFQHWDELRTAKARLSENWEWLLVMFIGFLVIQATRLIK